MDSGNSGSMQSSSGGDEEYDSSHGAGSISAFLSPTYSTGGRGSCFSLPPPPSQRPSSAMFDSVSNYFDPSTLQLPSAILSLDTVCWPKAVRSEPNCTEINPVMASTSMNQLPDQQSQMAQQNATPGPSSSSSGHRNQRAATIGSVARNPRKRSRASRRAPTTVLTTDTTNFRAMVQEFTGIPSAPFAPSSFRSGLDLFGTGSSVNGSTLHVRGNPLQPPPYLSRPFPQKIQMQPPLSTLPFLTTSFSTSATPSTATTTSTISSGANGDLVNMQSSILTFQSLLQTSSNAYPPPNSNINFGSAAPGSSRSSDLFLKMGLGGEFGLGRAQFTGLPTLVSVRPADISASRGRTNPGNWADEGLESNDGNQGQSRPFNDSALDYHSRQKVEENVTARSEGMVESWIYSSD
ncbi:hypothetical protein Nepgr_007785 [Nepenthes gracilis]|uniref:VQ domain-containing protein n=1 Tax=Nepenthes gracilis TaxID=150966 RepID=A0AAD3S7M1_NEPGR|nr:hypothetical protein Nepgr_007785 [Nepenthes gracilis]